MTVKAEKEKSIMQDSGILPLYKAAVFSYLIDPLFYLSTLITLLFAAFRFFFVAKFFSLQTGSSDLRPLFNAIPYVSIITAPLLILRLRPLLLDDSIPVRPFNRFLSLTLAAFTAFAFPIILLISLPLCVNLFGNVDFLQTLTSILGILLYGLSSCILCILFSSCFASSPVLPLILSSVSLALTDFIHLLPLYYKTGSFLSFICHFLSFAWHFDSFSKGIIDSRNIFYYSIIVFFLLLLSSLCEYRRLGKKVSSLTVFLFSAILLLLSLSASNLYFRLDVSSSRQFSVSKTSREVLSNLENELKITYYRSNELKNLYPQVSDVAEFLSAYSSTGSRISFTIEKADAEKLKALGIQGQQIRNDKANKTEFITVYSAILIQYLEKSSLIPFVLSTSTLEYDLTQRIQKLITDGKRKVYLLCGNGRSLEEAYAYAAPYLDSRGFESEELNEFNTKEVLKSLTSEDEIAVFGTKELSDETSFLLQAAVDRGTKAFFATSPFHTSVEEEWKVTKHKDPLISYLNSRGFAFDNSLVEDISCYPLMMQSGEGNTAEYRTENYPLWVVLQSQKEAQQGATVFWASPLVCYEGVKPLLQTSPMAWTQEPAGDEKGNLFLTNPFLLPKTASAGGAQTGVYTVGARKDNISLVSDQFFVSSLTTALVSGESSLDFRNYDYMAKELLILRGEEKLASLMQKSLPVTSLYKITDEKEFESAKKGVLALNFVLLPLLILSLYAQVTFRRRKNAKAE